MSDALFSGLQADHGKREDANKSDKRIADAIRGSLFPKQLAVLQDGSRVKAVVCPRRAGKSWTALSYAHDIALRKPQSVCVIICLTLKSAKQIYWNSTLPRFQRTFGIKPANVHHTDQRITFDNGSIIFFVGAETKAELEKLRGASYDLVVVDEAKSYPPDLLRELLTDVLRPALLDRRGTVMMIGTPGSILDGPFYEGTYPGALDPKDHPFARTYDAPEDFWVKNPSRHTWRYSRHSWTAQDNTALPHLWEDALLIKEQEGWADNHPTWCREYLGQWVSSDDAFVYAYAGLSAKSPHLVQWKPDFSQPQQVNSGSGTKHGLPAGTDYRYVLGMDLGFEDDFALVVGAYDLESGILYHVYDFKLNHQDVYQVADHLSRAIDRFDGRIDAAVADNVGSGKMVIETLNRRHGFNIQPAEKREKWDFIELLNADFHSGKCKLIPGSDLDFEMRTLQFDLGKGSKELLARTGRLREHPGLPNHLCFVAGTLIATARGEVPVESLVVSDLVWTRQGLRPIRATMATDTRPTVEIELEDGTVLRGTPDHPILTPDGYCRLDNFAVGDILSIWEKTDLASHLSTAGASTFATPALVADTFESTGATDTNTYTGYFGWNETAPSPLGGTYTTLAATPSTTRLTTSRSYQQESMRQAISASGRCSPSSVKGVVFPLSSDSTPPSTVANGARQRPAAHLALTTNPAAARGALPSSFAQSISPLPRVVPIRVRRVSNTPAAVVYNLSVEDVHEYFANGVSVGNCDAFLYLWRYSYHTYATPATRGPAPGSTEWYASREQESIQRLIQHRDSGNRTDLDSVLRSRSIDPLAHLSNWRYEK